MTGNGIVVTWKQLIGAIGGFITLLGLLVVLHTTFVVPAILAETGAHTDSKVLEHEHRGAHPNGVTRAEFELLINQLMKRLDRIEHKLDDR